MIIVVHIPAQIRIVDDGDDFCWVHISHWKRCASEKRRDTILTSFSVRENAVPKTATWAVQPDAAAKHDDGRMSEGESVFVLLVVLVASVWYLARRKKTKRVIIGIATNRNFVKLGDIRGRSFDDVVARVGRPNSMSTVADGILYQWQKTSWLGGFHYAILFDQNLKAITYTHQWTS